MRNQVLLPTIMGVQAAGGHCVLNLPLGMTYDLIQFAVTNITAANMLNFKVKVGSSTIVDLASFQDFEDLNTFYRRQTQAGFLTLWFYRPEYQEDVRALTSLGTADITAPITIEFDLPALTSPAITAYAVQRPPQVMGAITKIREYTANFTAAGLMAIDNIPRGARIAAFHLRKAAGDVTNLDLEVNNGSGAALVQTGPKALYETIQKQYNRVPVTATYTHMDLCLLGDFASPMPTAQLADMRLKPTVGSSGSVVTMVEYIDGLRGV